MVNWMKIDTYFRVSKIDAYHESYGNTHTEYPETKNNHSKSIILLTAKTIEFRSFSIRRERNCFHDRLIKER